MVDYLKKSFVFVRFRIIGFEYLFDRFLNLLKNKYIKFIFVIFFKYNFNKAGKCFQLRRIFTVV